MGTKLLLSLYVSLSLYGFLKSAENETCPGQQQLIYNTVNQPIFYYNPGGISNPVVANCSSYLGYNINASIGLSATLSYCTSMVAGDTVFITDGTTTATIDKAVCDSNNNGGNQIELFNGSYSNYLNITVTEVSAALFAITFKNGTLLAPQVTTTPAATPAPYNRTNPQSARMELAFAVDTSLGLGTTFFNNITKPIIQNLASSFIVGSEATRFSLVRLASQSSLGGSLGPAWQIDQSLFKSLLTTIFLPGASNSIFSTTLTQFIKDAFNVSGETPARNQTQKVLIIFVNNDVNSNDNASNFQDLALLLMNYDVHPIIVNMGTDPLTNLLSPLISTLKGSNKLRYKQYNDTDGVDGTVNNLLSQVLLNGEYLCATGIEDNNVTVNSSSLPIGVTITLPYSNQQSKASIVQRQAYCNNMNFQYTHIPQDPKNGITVTVVQEETTAGTDYLDVYNGNVLVASFSGLEVTQAEICFNNAPNVTVALDTENSWILNGVIVNIVETAAPCPEPTWPPVFYRRKK